MAETKHSSEICIVTGTRVFSIKCGDSRKPIVNHCCIYNIGSVMAEVQQGFCLISISLCNARCLDHLSYRLKIMACQGLGQSWDVMQGITNTTTK